jgi:hypothetical protein
MNPHLRLTALLISLGLLVLIVDLVRKRRLREEYAWLWMITGLAILVVGTWTPLLLHMTRLVGAKFPASMLFFAGVLFLTLISLHFSTEISRLADQNKELAQRVAVLDGELRARRGSAGDAG